MIYYLRIAAVMALFAGGTALAWGMMLTFPYVLLIGLFAAFVAV